MIINFSVYGPTHFLRDIFVDSIEIIVLGEAIGIRAEGCLDFDVLNYY